MARKPINLSSIEKFTLPYDKEPKTVWHLGPLDTQLIASLEDEMLQYKVEQGDAKLVVAEQWMSTRMNRRYVEIVRFGLKGWENLLNDENKSIPYVAEEYVVNAVGTRTGVKNDLLKTIQMEDITALALRILELNKLSGADAKN